MLMRMTINKQNIPYYFLGFILAAYMGVPVLGVAMIGVILVLVKFNFLDKQAVTETEAVQGCLTMMTSKITKKILQI